MHCRKDTKKWQASHWAFEGKDRRHDKWRRCSAAMVPRPPYPSHLAASRRPLRTMENSIAWAALTQKQRQHAPTTSECHTRCIGSRPPLPGRLTRTMGLGHWVQAPLLAVGQVGRLLPATKRRHHKNAGPHRAHFLPSSASRPWRARHEWLALTPPPSPPSASPRAAMAIHGVNASKLNFEYSDEEKKAYK